MAAEIVVWDNLRRALESEEVRSLPYSRELESLKASVENVEGALMALEAGEQLDSEVTPSRLDHLVALLHEADDLLDSILTFTNSRGITNNREVSKFLPSSNKLVLCMKLAGPLKRISQGIGQLVRELEHKFPSIDNLDREFHLPACATAENKVIGREKDKERIVDMLIRPKKKTNSNVSVIPVVGLSGLGKSALVRSVYEDEKVENHFDLRMWIHVSGILDEGEIIREIVESCTCRKSIYREKNPQPAKILHSKSYRNEVPFHDLLGCKRLGKSIAVPSKRPKKNEMDIIERRLRKEIDGKLFLIVLDDAFVKQWSRLKDLLAGGAKGSQILVTTNLAEVADLAKTETYEVYKLEGLSFDVSLGLFRESAFRKGDQRDPNLEAVGKDIVRFCNGAPLTIRVAGSLLYGKTREKWVSFKNDLRFTSEDKKNITEHILEHSYNDLPTRIKACFSYCSLFPEDFEFNMRDLISLWIAQGFIDPQHAPSLDEADRQQNQSQSLEEVGENYFLELSRRYFFHKMSTDDLGNTKTCKMHPLLHNLARQKAAQIVSIFMGYKDVGNIPDTKYKHVSFSCDTDSSSIKIPPSLLRARTLRTLVSIKEPDCDGKLDRLVCNTLISKFKCLRVLDLHDLAIDELPESISDLIHLRYLDLSKNDLVTLPRSVTKLYNLQTLKLNSCAKLSRLEGNFGELANLKRFELDECDSLTGMPCGLERLTQLEMLSCFIVGKDYYLVDMPTVGLKALKQLNNLKGRLEIELTGDLIADIDEASQAELQKKSHLQELKINWARPISNVERSSLPSEEDKSRYQELLEHLQPHPNLKILRIEGYKGEDFPSWAMLASSLRNLVVITIEGCDKCQNLPPFGALSSLKRLSLRHMANVKYVESNELLQDAMQEPSSFFKSLEELTLHNFYKLKRWRKEMISTSKRYPPVRYFPKLTKLRIWNCPKLISMPLFQKVSDLDLLNVNQQLLEEFARSTGLSIRPTNVSCIKNLQIKRCPNLSSFKAVRKGLGGLPHLEQLLINRCDSLTSLASELRYLTSLKQLEISGCEELDLSDDGSHNMVSSNMTSWISLGRLQDLTLGGIMKTPWTSLKSLRYLTLKEIPKLKTLPDGLKHVQTLKFLWLSTCNALEELPEWISSLIVLQHLRIDSCPAVKRFPDEIKEVSSLMKVEITGCPELMERCREHTGEDWHKIKHARILLHKSWRYELMSELGATQNRSAFSLTTLDDAKYFIIPVLPVDELV